MNKDRIAGSAKEIKGAVKETIGKAVGDAKLESDGMLGGIEVEVVWNIAVHERAARDHLGVEPRPARDQAEEVPAMPVCPVHHRSDAQPVRCVVHAFGGFTPGRSDEPLQPRVILSSCTRGRLPCVTARCQHHG